MTKARRPAPRAAAVTAAQTALDKLQAWLAKRPAWLTPLVLLSATLLMAATSAAQKSVTVDEFQALPHGLFVLRTADFHLSTGVPPLAAVLPAAPLALSNARLDLTDAPQWISTWQCGSQFMVDNADRYHDLFLCGRAISLLALLLVCWQVWRTANRLHGPAGGLLAGVVVCFSPNLLAHGPLVTPDIYLTVAVLGAVHRLDRLLERPTAREGLILGVWIGGGSLCKFTALLLLPLFGLLILGWQVAGKRSKPSIAPRPAVGRLWRCAALAIASLLVTINVGYLFDGSFSPLGGFQFETAGFQQLQAALPAWVPVPVPHSFFRGLDVQLAEQGYDAYLLGEFNDRGFLLYYLVALLVKVPAAVWLLAGLACLAGRPTRGEALTLATALALVIFFSLARHKNIGVRYVLFVEPLVAIWIGRLAAAPAAWRGAWRRRAQWTALLGAATLPLVALQAWPDYLAWFNLPSGGPAHGHRYLLDSNLDWGQDLIALKKSMDDRGIDSVDLAYFGRVRPEIYGVNYRPLGAGPPGRFAAISANLLWGRMYFVNGTGYWPDDRDTYAQFRGLQPLATPGHSIYLFDLQRVVNP